MVDLIDDHYFDFMEKCKRREYRKERDGPLVFPGYSLHEIPLWDYRVYNKIIVFFFPIQILQYVSC